MKKLGKLEFGGARGGFWKGFGGGAGNRLDFWKGFGGEAGNGFALDFFGEVCYNGGLGWQFLGGER